MRGRTVRRLLNEAERTRTGQRIVPRRRRSGVISNLSSKEIVQQYTAWTCCYAADAKDSELTKLGREGTEYGSRPEKSKEPSQEFTPEGGGRDPTKRMGEVASLRAEKTKTRKADRKLTKALPKRRPLPNSREKRTRTPALQSRDSSADEKHCYYVARKTWRTGFQREVSPRARIYHLSRRSLHSTIQDYTERKEWKRVIGN